MRIKLSLSKFGNFSIRFYCLFFLPFILDEDKWKTEARTEGGAIQEYTISYQNLVPSTSYTFRVIAYNKHGISYPVKSADAVSFFYTSRNVFLCNFRMLRLLLFIFKQSMFRPFFSVIVYFLLNRILNRFLIRPCVLH